MTMPRALVVGAAGGVGLAVTTALLERGFDVIGTVLGDDQAGVLQAQCPGVSRVCHLDLSDADAARDVLSATLATTAFDPDVVILCSGISPFGPVETTSLTALRATLEINTLGCVATYQACMPSLRRTRGRMIFVSSMAGRVGMPFLGHYAASKFALEGLADAMRQEAHRWGVKICLVEPGGIQTPLVSNEIEQVRQAITRLRDETLDNYGELYRQFLQRLETNYANCLLPEVVADAICEMIDATDPPARREIGADAIRICAIAHADGARGTDALFRAAYNGALG